MRKSVLFPKKLKTNYNCSDLETDLTVIVADLGAAIDGEQEAGHAALAGAELIASAARQVAPLAGSAVTIQPTESANAHVSTEVTAPGRSIASLVETSAVRVEGANSVSQAAVARRNDKAFTTCCVGRGIDAWVHSIRAPQGLVVGAGRCENQQCDCEQELHGTSAST